MASSRSSTPADTAGSPVARAVAAWAEGVPTGARVAVALSGGRDSMVLLDAAVAALRDRVDIHAFHVHHGLQREADRWVAFCAEACSRRGVRYDWRAVTIGRRARASLEAGARDARYAALRALALGHGVGVVALAHHQDDQAETLLLQLGRGAGPRGLAAMPSERTDGQGIAWARPLLGVPRAAIDAYATARAIVWIDDPSNRDPRHRRNALRLTVAPALAAVFPGYPDTLARAAHHQSDAVELSDALAAIDAAAAGYDATDASLDCAVLAALAPARSRNLIRWWLCRAGLPPPSSARLDAIGSQLASPRADARIAIAHAGAVIGRHRGRACVHDPRPPEYRLDWRGESTLRLPHGELAFEPGNGAGIDRSRAAPGLTVRPRHGGEKLRLQPGGPLRSLKTLLQQRGVPDWERAALPLIVDGETLVAVPGIGIDVGWRAPAGAPGLVPVWRRRNENTGGTGAPGVADRL